MEVDLRHGSASRIPDSTKIYRAAKAVEGPYQTCASDPGLIGACRVVHGRLSIYNGGPSTRIWVVGSKRMLGVPSEVVPQSVWRGSTIDNDAFGDFRVCPLERQKPGHMQFVCIDSARNVIFRTR
jgi:hypothetical protein